MNSSDRNLGGWQNSNLRSYLNSIIFNSFPDLLKDEIITTYVVSGHGINDSNNFITTDYLYLLSSLEVNGNTTYDTVDSSLTRQLDYYKNSSNYNTNYKKYDNSYTWWWARSAISATNYGFYGFSSGNNGYYDANISRGVSPAFRLG